MYESARTPMKPRDIRRRASTLMKQCWLTLLIASVLLCLFTWVGNAVEAHGERLATEAYKTAYYAHLAEHHAGDDFDTSWVAVYQAEDAYDDAFTPWEWLGYGIDLIGLLFQCVIAIRLCRGLLSALRGGECTPHCLLSGFTRTATACWLGLQRGLRILGWMLLPLLFSVLISHIFSYFADNVKRLLMLLISLWATLHYALAEVHLVDDPYDSLTAKEALRQAVDDAGAFGVWQMCKVLWPVVIPFGISIAASLLSEFTPMPERAAEIISVPCRLVMSVFPIACCVCIYDEIRQRIRANEEAVPANEGLARARALSQS